MADAHRTHSLRDALVRRPGKPVGERVRPALPDTPIARHEAMAARIMGQWSSC